MLRVCESSSNNLVFRCFFVDESNVRFLHLCSFRAAELYTTKGFHRSTGCTTSTTCFPHTEFLLQPSWDCVINHVVISVMNSSSKKMVIKLL